jgi:excisionase family DNA binding protein
MSFNFKECRGMAVTIRGETYYRTSEAARLASISKSTLIRWLNNGTIKGTIHKDRRGWRVFSDSDIEALIAEAGRINE